MEESHLKREGIPDETLKSRLFTKDGKPLRVLSTSLGVALLANAVLLPGVSSAESDGTPSSDVGGAPKLIEWSTAEAKAYFDPAVDWSLPIADDGDGQQQGQQQGSGQATGSVGGAGGTTVIPTSSGFGWDDLMLYHLLFNNGSAYSSTAWTSAHPTYYGGTTRRYTPKTYDSGAFQNKPVPGSSVRPKTSDTTGSITRRSTSSSKGGIGGNSSGYSSSVSRSSSSRSFGGFGG